MQRIVFDRYCRTAVSEVNNEITAYDSADQFVEMTGFNFPETQRVFMEVEREHFVVERAAGVVVTGRDLPEVQWLLDHMDEIGVAGAQLNASREVVVTWDDTRKINLFLTDWMVIRHVEQSTAGNTTLTTSQYNELSAYRQALRDMTAESEFPTPPSFVQLN